MISSFIDLSPDPPGGIGAPLRGENYYHQIPSPDDDNEVVVFPIKDLHLHRNDFNIPIPEVEVTLQNVRSLYSITKGPFALIRLVLISSNFWNTFFCYFCHLLEPSNL